MGNYHKTKSEVCDYLAANIPLVLIRSAERDRVENMLREISKEIDRKIYFYTEANGVSLIGGNTNLNDKPSGTIMKYIQDKFKMEGQIFCIADARHLEDYNLYTKDLLDLLFAAKERHCTLILISEDSVWSSLMRFGMVTTLDYPDREERMDIIRQFKKDSVDVSVFSKTAKKLSSYLHSDEYKSLVEWDDEDIVKASALLRGFSKVQIDNILATQLRKHKRLTKENVSSLNEQKSRFYASVPSVEHVKVNQNLSSAGLSNLKKWLNDNKRIFFMDDELLRDRDLSAPKGILLAGVPGCGKSLSAKIVAKEWELPLFRFDIGSVYDKWMGNSEKRMEDALAFIDHVAPCVLWVDEIEKALSVSDSGNDTAQRILGKFLFWLQESESRVFLIATANDISGLPPELYRKGRFSEIFYIGLPDEEERREVISLYINRSLHVDPGTMNLDSLVELSKGFSYSDIEQCIKDVGKMALLSGDEIITSDLLCAKFRNALSISKSNDLLISKLKIWGREHAVSASGKEKV